MMNRAEMERIWNGPIVDSSKRNRFDGKHYEMTLRIHRREVVAEFKERGFYKNPKAADQLRDSLADRMRAEFPPGSRANLDWVYSHPREVN